MILQWHRARPHAAVLFYRLKVLHPGQVLLREGGNVLSPRGCQPAGQRLLGQQGRPAVVQSLDFSGVQPVVERGTAVAAQLRCLVNCEHIRTALPPFQEIGAQPGLVQRPPGRADGTGTAGESPSGDGILQQPGIPPLQKNDHILQLNGEAPSLFSGIHAGDNPLLQQPAGLPLADVADTVELAHGDGGRV